MQDANELLTGIKIMKNFFSAGNVSLSELAVSIWQIK